MKLALLVILAELAMLIGGFAAPTLFFLAYLWNSLLYPSAFTHPYLDYVPLTLIFGLFSLGGYFLIDKRQKLHFPGTFFIAAIFAFWVTVTTLLALRPDLAWPKWEWAVQSIVLAIATPCFLRTRVQIEAGFLCVLAALAPHVLTAGIKSIVGTGGYGQLGRLMMTNFWLGETSTLSLAAVMTIPIAYYAIRHSVILENLRGRILDIAFLGYSLVAVMCVIGTAARTGLIAVAALFLFGIPGIWKKVAIGALALLVFAGVQSYLPTRSLERYNTISTYRQDGSASVRLAVWHWTMGFAKEHPFGGGFGTFALSEIEATGALEGMRSPGTTGPRTEGDNIIRGRAAHSIYFEVLGEQGYFGELLFLSVMFGSVWGLLRARRLAKNDPDHAWVPAFARCTMACLMVFAVGGAFIGIAFQPLVYAFVGFYFSLYRLMHPATAAVQPRVELQRPIPTW